MSRLSSINVCVFCGSNEGNNPNFKKETKILGRGLANRKWKTVYGGGKIGLMGILADSVIQSKGIILGIIPKFLANKEMAHQNLSELKKLETIISRKSTMIELSNFFVALPGGIGTLDEILEIITLTILGKNKNPIIIVNINNYWKPLITLFKNISDKKFLSINYTSYVYLVSNSNEALKLLDKLSNNIKK